MSEEGVVIRRFKDTFLRNGRVIFICEDKAIAEWLHTVVHSLKRASRALIRLIRPDELVKRVKVADHSTTTPEELPQTA